MKLSVWQPAAVIILGLAACAAPAGRNPSLAPRPAEAIDPRVPITSDSEHSPAEPVLVARLATLVGQARGGNSAFDAAAAEAEKLVAVAGAPQSESWIAAQQALSVALAARAPTTTALGDIDALVAATLQARGDLPAADLAAIRAATAQVGELDRQQSDIVDRLQARLGR